MTAKVVQLTVLPGIQRDGTLFNAPSYVNGSWVRFQNKLPRKMGGYRGMFLNGTGISRGMTMSSQNGLNYVVSGYSAGLEQWTTDNDDGVGFGPTPILPAGPILTVAITNAGSSYTNGTYTAVALQGGTGTGALATVVVSLNAIVTVTITTAGFGYALTDTLTVLAASVGGTGSGFVGTVSALTTYSPSADNLWQFDIGYDSTGGGVNQIIAHPGQNLTDITSTINTRPLFGVFGGATVAAVGVFTASGTTTNTSTSVTFATTILAIGPGVAVTGPGIPAGTTVVSASLVSSVWTAVLSQAATASATVTLTFDNNVSVSGGVVMLHPYLFVYGNYGLIKNSSAGDFNNWTAADANETSVSTGKVIKGLPLRGGTTSPAGLFWTTDSVVRVSYSPTTVGGATFYWRYDLITSQSSIMSSQCVIEYDGIFYWAGVDRFLMYNGVVQEVPNTQNMNWFFENVNYNQRQKVWCTKVPRWGEVWWFYPRGDATECTDAIIYNVREKCWYDAGEALGARRSAGTFSEVFRFPVWGSTEANSTGGYTMWQHETGTNQIYLNTVNAIDSFFETPTLGAMTGLVGSNQGAGDNLWTRCERVEPDFVQAQQMYLIVTGKGYADDTDQPSDPYYFDDTTLKVDMREQRREMRLRFGSNTQNGNYFAGRILLSLETGDVRGTGNP